MMHGEGLPNNGEYKSKPQNMNNAAGFLTDPNLETVFSAPDNMKEESTGLLLYYKPAAGLTMLREQVLGHERFDLAFRTYIARWAYKHREPSMSEFVIGYAP